MLKFRHVICPIILMLSACHNNSTSQPADSTHIPAATGAPTPGDSLGAAPAASNANPSSPETPGKKTIIFFGNSLTAGYGLDSGQAFPTLIGHRLDSLRLPYKVINAGISGETSAGGKSRLNWTLRQPADIFVLELGANDGLRGIPVNSTRDNLQSIIDTVRHKYPSCKILLAGMLVPPSMGSTYGDAFHEMFPQLAKRNNISLIPFLLDGVGGNPALNQGDGIHPNFAGEKIVTETVWKALQPLL
ncbi:MAG TPA: arylesterase [Puia sp.]|jgi:acyl-CoA thioesterase-1|nr:arylesterase [Puia sp.]